MRSFPGNDIPDAMAAAWAAATAGGPPVAARGTFETPSGEAAFATTGLEQDGSQGLFVVAILPAAERRQIGDVQRLGTGFLLASVVLGGGSPG